MLTLRHVHPDDWLAVHTWASRPEFCRYQPWGPNTPDASRRFVDNAAAAWTQSPQARFPYIAIHDGRPVGTGELRIRNRDHRQGEITYGLHPDLWGHGLGTLARLGGVQHSQTRMDRPLASGVHSGRKRKVEIIRVRILHAEPRIPERTFRGKEVTQVGVDTNGSFRTMVRDRMYDVRGHSDNAPRRGIFLAGDSQTAIADFVEGIPFRALQNREDGEHLVIVRWKYDPWCHLDSHECQRL
jgi:hypothetical protein